MMNVRSSDASTTARFDENSQKDVFALAARLQRQHYETVSGSDMEQAAAEAGLNPEFVREAIRILANKPPEVMTPPIVNGAPTNSNAKLAEWLVATIVPLVIGLAIIARGMMHMSVSLRGHWLAGVLIVWGLVGLGILGFIQVRRLGPETAGRPSDQDSSTARTVVYSLVALTSLSLFFDTSQVGPSGRPECVLIMLALSPFVGALQRSRKDSFWMTVLAWAVLWFAVGLNCAVVVHSLILGFWPWLECLMFGGCFYGSVGWVSYWVRSLFSHSTPLAPSAESDRTQMLRQMFELQSALKSHAQNRSFLSVDVVGSSHMKANASELEIEYSFREFQTYIANIVEANGGQIQFTAGDGAMAMFLNTGSAVRAAKQIQSGIAAFNAEKNHLPGPFRLRCGVSEGEVAIDASLPLGHIQSRVVDRAATLQKGAPAGSILVGEELIGTAMPILGSLRQLDLPSGDLAYAWP